MSNSNVFETDVSDFHLLIAAQHMLQSNKNIFEQMKPLLRQCNCIEKSMKRSRVRNNFWRSKSQEDRLKYSKQRNVCEKPPRIVKKLYSSTKIIKVNSDIFASCICLHFNYCIKYW